MLADTIDLPCRIAKGCKYCKREDASSCLVRFDNDRYAMSINNSSLAYFRRFVVIVLMSECNMYYVFALSLALREV